MKLSDEGYYRVTAKNKLGEDSKEARLKTISKSVLLKYYLAHTNLVGKTIFNIKRKKLMCLRTHDKSENLKKAKLNVII